MSQLIFDKYEVIRRLAVGGMGEIFLARQRGVAGFDRLVILKSLLPDLAEQPGFIDQFLDEARVAATLNHPNIVSIYEVGAWQGVYFIAMEYINGDSVAGLIPAALQSGTPIPFPVTAKVVHDAALGLDHAHHASDPDGRPLHIVHRDVTPQNIMVRADGVTKVVDFGVARAANRATRTATGLVKGKVPYMPPEQISGRDLDGRTDQWGLGVVLWEMLTGRRLFKADNDAQAIGLILHLPIPRPSQVVPGVPGELEAVVLRMLERERERRYPRLADVALALRGYLDSVSVEASEAKVAECIQRIAGSRIKERVSDLTPSRPDNFLISLAKPGSDTEGAATTQDRPPARPKKPVALIATVAAVTAAALVAGVLVWRPWAPKDVPAPPPPVAVTAAQPDAAAEVALVSPPDASAAEAAPTILNLTSDPPEAMVYLGERLLGQTPLRLSTLVPETDYQLVLDHAGYEQAIFRTRLTKGETTEATVPLKKKAKAPPGHATAPIRPVTAPPLGGANPAASQDGFLSLRTTPWTKVVVGGTPFGSTPLFKAKLPAGQHSVHLVNEEAGIDVTRSVEIKPGEVTKLDLTLGK